MFLGLRFSGMPELPQDMKPKPQRHCWVPVRGFSLRYHKKRNHTIYDSSFYGNLNKKETILFTIAPFMVT